MNRVWIELLSAIAAALGIATLASASLIGMLSHQLLGVVIVFGLIWGVLSRVYLLLTKKVELGFWRAPWEPRFRHLLRQALGRGFFWFALTLAALAIFPQVGLTGFMVGLGVAGGLRVALELLPPRQTGRGVTAVMAVAGLLMVAELSRSLLPGDPAEIVLEPPVAGEWIVLQGGRTSLVSHHVAAYNQKHALDLVRLEGGQIFNDDGDIGNEDWFSWEQPLFAPVAGTIVAAEDGTEDSVGLNLVSDPEKATGNHVIIETEDGRFVLLAHIRNGTVSVAKGDAVVAGQPIGEVGNSGNTTAPHLHMQVQTHASTWDEANRSVPFAFTGGERALSRNALVQGRTP